MCTQDWMAQPVALLVAETMLASDSIASDMSGLIADQFPEAPLELPLMYMCSCFHCTNAVDRHACRTKYGVCFNTHGTYPGDYDMYNGTIIEKLCNPALPQ